MQALWRNIVLVVLVLLVPIVPFLLLGDRLEDWLHAWSVQTGSRRAVALAVVGLLSTDVLLPVPSSFVSTFGGSQLGAWWGTWASWLGMSLGAGLGFGLARWLGPPFARRMSRSEDLEAIGRAVARWGPLMLVVARGVPVFAEASVLLAGIHRLSWRRFLPVVLASNLGIALAYSAFGQWAAERQWLPLALGISVGLPVLWTWVARRWWAAGGGESAERPTTVLSAGKNEVRP